MTPALAGVLGRIAGYAAFLLAAMPTWAQDHKPATSVAGTVDFVKTGLFMISSDGVNTVVRLTGNGMILVDGKLPGHYAPLVARAHAIADELPVRLVVLTGSNEKRIGTNREFLQAGIPVMAQEHTKEVMAQRALGDEKTALPSVTFGEQRTLKLGGVALQLLHFSSGCTDGDAVVYFADLKVVAVGDLYTNTMPLDGSCSGVNLQGWGAALHKILQLDFDTVLPGTGPSVKRAELEALASRIDKLAAAMGPD